MNFILRTNKILVCPVYVSVTSIVMVIWPSKLDAKQKNFIDNLTRSTNRINQKVDLMKKILPMKTDFLEHFPLQRPKSTSHTRIRIQHSR